MAVPVATRKVVKDTFGEYKFGFKTDSKAIYKSPKGLSKEVVEQISKQKNEPAWMLELRLKALEVFYKKPMPTWGGDLSTINFDEIHYYLRPQDKEKTKWEDVPEEIKNTFEKLGIPQAE